MAWNKPQTRTQIVFEENTSLKPVIKAFIGVVGHVYGYGPDWHWNIECCSNAGSGYGMAVKADEGTATSLEGAKAECERAYRALKSRGGQT